MTVLWKRQAFLAAIAGELLGDLQADIRGVSIDSRSLQPGDAFFAIRGERFDGHDFAAAAAGNGAAVLVVEKSRVADMEEIGVPLLAVEDALAALGQLGSCARKRCGGKIIAVTGSVGKTTVKEMLRHVLGEGARVHANPASFNNHWGVPLTLARMPEDTDFGIFEIGMNHDNEIRPLVKQVAPHVAIITCVAAAHLGYFSSLEAIADAKAEIFEGLPADGIAVLNADDALYGHLLRRAEAAGVKRIATFGAAEKADYRLLDFYPNANGSCFTARLGGLDSMVKLAVPGRHMVYNALAALAAADCVGADLARVVLALQDFRAENGRGARYELELANGGRVTLIDESYNANPASMRAGLALLGESRPVARGRRIAVLGDMLELGRFSRAAHEELAEPVRAAKTDLVFLAGGEMEYLAAVLRGEMPVHYRKTVAELLPLVLEALRAGDVVMIKSSNGIGAARIVAALLDRYPPVVS